MTTSTANIPRPHRNGPRTPPQWTLTSRRRVRRIIDKESVEFRLADFLIETGTPGEGIPMRRLAEGRPDPPNYWAKRRQLIYYRYVDLIVRAVAPQAKSMIDVGSSNSSVIESFDWVPLRHTLDSKTPYCSNSVRGIRQDFFSFDPEIKYDLAICLQVLEHVPDAGNFAQKLFDVAHAVLISVPYQWPKGSCKHHLHDPVDSEKLREWTRRKASYQIVAKELLTYSTKSRRLIAYYHDSDKNFSLAEARHNLKQSTESI